MSIALGNPDLDDDLDLVLTLDGPIYGYSTESAAYDILYADPPERRHGEAHRRHGDRAAGPGF